jgi:hypothetical protein
MWEAQVAKAQWKAPCAAQGRMECTNGHKLKMDPAIICDKKVWNNNYGKIGCHKIRNWESGNLMDDI